MATTQHTETAEQRFSRLNDPNDPNYYAYSNVPLTFDEWFDSDQVLLIGGVGFRIDGLAGILQTKEEVRAFYNQLANQ